MEVDCGGGCLLLGLVADEGELPEYTVFGVLELNVGDDSLFAEEIAKTSFGYLNEEMDIICFLNTQLFTLAERDLLFWADSWLRDETFCEIYKT